jgi:hypothetical protein
MPDNLALSYDAEEWFVSDGESVVGPVAAERVARGVDAGKVALDHWARHAEWGEDAWVKVGDLPEFRSGERSGVRLAEVEPPSPAEARKRAIARELPSIIGASSQKEGALHLLAACVLQLGCEGGVVHLLDAQRTYFTTACAQGPNACEVLGARLKRKDPAMKLLANVRALLGESYVGPGRVMTASRLHALGVATLDVLAIPLRVRGELVGAIELGAPQGRPRYEAADVELVEELAAGLALTPA